MDRVNTHWCCLYHTADRPLAEILHGMLVEQGIQVVLVNRQDSSYIFLGELELHVACAQLDEARALLLQALKK